MFLQLLKVQGFPIKRATQKLDFLEGFSAVDLRNYQERAKWDIFNFHRANNSWYQKFTGSNKMTAWEDIPLIEKRDIQMPLNEIVTGKYLNQRRYLNNTSGSTGVPFHFSKDMFCHAMTWAYIFRGYRKIGLEYGKSLQARFFGIPLSHKKYLKEKAKDWIAARVRFPIFDLSDKSMENYFQTFGRLPFVYIYGYTSSLVLFARFLSERSIVLNEVCHSLRKCVVTSEVCSNEDRILLEKSFGVSIRNEYGAAELDIIGLEDDKGNWLLNEENLFIEVLNDEGRLVATGEEGEIVITSLYNKAMPLIRYRLGDRIILKDGLVSGRRAIKSVTGRTNDVALLPSGKRVPGLTFYYVSKTLLEQGGFIREFVIKQVSPNGFHFEYVAIQTLASRQKQEIQKLMDQYLEPGLTATFERKERIERTAAGKFKHFQYMVD